MSAFLIYMTFLMSQRVRHPMEPAPPDPVLRRQPFPRLPSHELCGQLLFHLHLVGQAAEDRQPVQQVHTERRRQEGAVDCVDAEQNLS